MDKHKQGKSNRDRGAEAERQVADIFKAAGFRTVRRGQVFNHESDVIGVPGLHIEVKYCKTAKVWEWLRQAELEAELKGDGVPVIWFRRPRVPFRVIVPARLFLEMYAAWRKEQES